MDFKQVKSNSHIELIDSAFFITMHTTHPLICEGWHFTHMLKKTCMMESFH